MHVHVSDMYQWWYVHISNSMSYIGIWNTFLFVPAKTSGFESSADVNFVCIAVHHPDCMGKCLHLLKGEGTCVTLQYGAPRGWITENKQFHRQSM